MAENENAPNPGAESKTPPAAPKAPVTPTATTTKKGGKKQTSALSHGVSGKAEIESVDLEIPIKDNEGKVTGSKIIQYNKALWEEEKKKPLTVAEIKEGQPIKLRNPFLADAKEV